MKNKRKRWGILAMVLVFVVVVFGCDTGNGSKDNPKIDSDLNGTWAGVVNYQIGDGGEIEIEYKGEIIFDNGNFEVIEVIDDSVRPSFKGIYKTDNGEITIETTSFNDGTISEPEWYTPDEYKILGATDEEIYDELGPIAQLKATAYSVSGNTLTISGLGSYTKK